MNVEHPVVPERKRGLQKETLMGEYQKKLLCQTEEIPVAKTRIM